MPDTRNDNGGKSRLSQAEKSPAREREWHIFYLRPRTEKLVYKILMNLNYEVFFPVIQSIRMWKNRQKKKIELPLFPNYLFVQTFVHELHAIRSLSKVVAYVSCGGKPATLSNKEIEGIRHMLGLGREITVETKFSIGERVRILSGPLIGYEGVLIEQHSKTRFGIQLQAINHAVFIDIGQLELERL